MADSRDLLSVGVDVGTTTTQIVFSRLNLQDVSRPGQIPRINITDRKVIYQSPIVFTPLVDSDTIDADKLNQIVRSEYSSAGVEPSQVETGAVIITGETAKKKNADEILRALSGLAGEFVVSVAGPNVESLIAGKGAGAAQYSQTNFATVTNLDIGGGSANSATFRSGNLIGAAAMNYGGRILEIDHATGIVRHIAEPARRILEDIGLRLEIGDSPSFEDLRRFTDRMADMTVELIEGTNSPLAQKIYLTPPVGVSGKGSVLMFSGGIGHYYYNPIPIDSVSDATIHDDVGPLLAESLRKHATLNSYSIVPPAETVRATVLGASTQTVTLSGSTIWAEKEILPLKNVPVIRPIFTIAGRVAEGVSRPEGINPASVSNAISEAVTRWDVNLATDPFAIALELEKSLDYQSLTQLANGLNDFANTMPSDRPLIAIIERDYAQALGQTVKGLAPSRALLVIDQVGLSEGDYIDIGAPLMDGRVVPLSVKTLIFYH
ncbi:MAG: ethanolamine ammonia-lyase reactivating factor EutA [Anaerolineae bacterium]|nr:ethanolamine ammonia-lyase reactivating factor EutA [Anaerolineae bacterium]MBL8105179.1 ethanolamine ammonia-lyase reactivating factor EutA [Anaerolineales bacterium]MCC7188271.1 ethanolamine ammonia-lyase reactivating factor EutA [Anaerolineales bacterium]